MVPLAEIERNDWNLNISRYVDTSEEEERIDVAEAVRKLRALEGERAAAEAVMNRYLAELGGMTPDGPLSAGREDAAQSPGLRDPRQEGQRC